MAVSLGMDLTLSNYRSDNVEVSDDLVLWRYLDFPKFLDLITTSTLKMPRASSMEDGYEGVLGPAATTANLEAWKKRGEPSYLRNVSWNQELGETFFWRERTYISCWNAFPGENAGLWRIYGDDKGVVIKSTWGALKNSLTKKSDCVSEVFYGAVKYRDFDNDPYFTDSYTDQYFSKRHEFIHENEFRLVAQDNSRKHNYEEPDASDLPRFATLDCNLNVLIDEVVVSPRLGGWVQDGVKTVSEKFGGRWNVRHSNLYDPPEQSSTRF